MGEWRFPRWPLPDISEPVIPRIAVSPYQIVGTPSFTMTLSLREFHGLPPAPSLAGLSRRQKRKALVTDRLRLRRVHCARRRLTTGTLAAVVAKRMEAAHRRHVDASVAASIAAPGLQGAWVNHASDPLDEVANLVKLIKELPPAKPFPVALWVQSREALQRLGIPLSPECQAHQGPLALAGIHPRDLRVRVAYWVPDDWALLEDSAGKFQRIALKQSEAPNE